MQKLNLIRSEENDLKVHLPIIIIHQVNKEQKVKSIFKMSLTKLVKKMWREWAWANEANKNWMEIVEQIESNQIIIKKYLQGYILYL